jgi:hypothetical protein
MSIHSTALGDEEAFVVSPRRAQYLLDVGHTRLYELMASKELESYKDGRSRKITTRSIWAYIDRQLGASIAA